MEWRLFLQVSPQGTQLVRAINSYGVIAVFAGVPALASDRIKGKERPLKRPLLLPLKTSRIYIRTTFARPSFLSLSRETFVSIGRVGKILKRR